VAANSLTAGSCPAAYPSGYGSRLASDATTWTYNAAGGKTAMTTPAPAGQTSPAYESTASAYDGAGNLTQVSAPPDSTGGPAQVTVSSYNAAGAMTSQTAGSGTPAASTTTWCYDPNGDQTAVVMPDGNTSGTATCQTTWHDIGEGLDLHWHAVLAKDSIKERLFRHAQSPGRSGDTAESAGSSGSDQRVKPGLTMRRRVRR
jgi:YD repeat-containing protein